jgi:1-acyl-sn-glycerol-3-phosphate acyltransferase
MYKLLKILFFGLVVKPIVLVALGLNIRNRQLLPDNGPAIIAANHNSHLDAIVLMSLFPLAKIHKVRPVAAADYFLKNRLLAWFSLNIIGIIPIQRDAVRNIDQYFAECNRSLNEKDILIIFPEGSRGNPGKMSQIKRGLYYLIKDRSDTNIYPVIMRGLGRALPRCEALFVPFNCDVIIGAKLKNVDNSHDFVQNLSEVYNELFQYCLTSNSID